MDSPHPPAPRRGISFGLKLTLAMVLMVSVLCLGSLLTMRQLVVSSYSDFLQTLFEAQVNQFFENQASRRALAQDTLEATADTRNVRLLAALEAATASPTAEVGPAASDDRFARVYSDLDFQLGPVLAHSGSQKNDHTAFPAAFFHFFDAQGRALPPPDATPELGGFVSEGQLAGELAPFVRATQAGAAGGRHRPFSGYAAFDLSHVYEITTVPIIDPYDNSLAGILVFGTLLDLDRDFGRASGALRYGLLLSGRLISNSIPPEVAGPLDQAVRAGNRPGHPEPFSAAGENYLLIFRPLQNQDGLPPAWHVALYSERELEDLTGKMTAVAGGILLAALLAGVVLAAFVSRRLTRPILDLVRATEAVGRGDYAAHVPVRSHDEIGRLSGSFNEMTAGLALKEKYRHVLDCVSDHEVAERLLLGELALGGEVRVVSVLFCDIRGFTPLAERLEPDQVIELLNEHMTALTAIVHRHHGVVDKFVGDALMALFGAPKSYGDDARDAASCALALLAERDRLNATTCRVVSMGIGVATGRVVAGCMGSADRLNYTVLGDRVNLAARLCARAAGGEILVDDATRGALAEAVVDTLEPLALKGISQPVSIFRLRALPAEVVA